MYIDKGTGGGFVNIDFSRRSLCLRHNGGGRVRRSLDRSSLKRPQFCRERGFGVFRFARQLLPDGSVIAIFAGSLFGAHPLACLGLCGKAGFFRLARGFIEDLPKAIQFFLQRLRRRGRIVRRDERARRKAAISKGAMKPDSEFARDF